MDLGGVTFATLNTSVIANKTSMAHLDRAVYNVLVPKFAAGLFENPYTDESRVNDLDNDYNRRLAREAAEQSVVMLKNADDFLPLDSAKMAKIKAVALIGPLADDAANQCGSYYSAGANVITVKAVSTVQCAMLAGVCSLLVCLFGISRVDIVDGG